MPVQAPAKRVKKRALKKDKASVQLREWRLLAKVEMPLDRKRDELLHVEPLSFKGKSLEAVVKAAPTKVLKAVDREEGKKASALQAYAMNGYATSKNGLIYRENLEVQAQKSYAKDESDQKQHAYVERDWQEAKDHKESYSNAKDEQDHRSRQELQDQARTARVEGNVPAREQKYGSQTSVVQATVAQLVAAPEQSLVAIEDRVTPVSSSPQNASLQLNFRLYQRVERESVSMVQSYREGTAGQATVKMVDQIKDEIDFFCDKCYEKVEKRLAEKMYTSAVGGK